MAATPVPALTPYFFAKQITAADCLAADISWIQCNAGINARYSTPTNVDAGAVTVDYYQLDTGDHVATVVFSSTLAGGQCRRRSGRVHPRPTAPAARSSAVR